jgi:hypothetical protein
VFHCPPVNILLQLTHMAEIGQENITAFTQQNVVRFQVPEKIIKIKPLNSVHHCCERIINHNFTILSDGVSLFSSKYYYLMHGNFSSPELVSQVML